MAREIDIAEADDEMDLDMVKKRIKPIAMAFFLTRFQHQIK